MNIASSWLKPSAAQEGQARIARGSWVSRESPASLHGRAAADAAPVGLKGGRRPPLHRHTGPWGHMTPDAPAAAEAPSDEDGPLARFSADAASVAAEPRRARDRFERDGLLRVRGAVPRAAAEALAAHVTEELPRRREGGDASWFGDVHGYEDAEVAGGARWDLKLALTPEVRAALSAKLGFLQDMI